MKDEKASLRGDDLLSPADIILPSQYFESVGSGGLSGEQRLMLAVLVDAINVLQAWKGSGNPRKRRNFAEAAQWVNTHGTLHPFSFDSVCDALEIDSEVLRLRLRHLTVRPANSAPAGLGRLRLRQLTRAQHMTANRPRRRERVRRDLDPSVELASYPAVQTEPDQDCSEEPSGSVAPLGNLLTENEIRESVSW